MNAFKKITTGVLALTMAAGIAGGAMAQVADPIDDDGGDVTVTIRSTGVLSVSITDLGLGTLQYKLVDQDVSGSIQVGATDLRGNADGWYVVLNGTEFGGPDDSFAVDQLKLKNGAVANDNINQNHPTNAVPLIAPAPATLAGNGTQIMTAIPGTGAGGYTLTYGATLTVPGGTLVGAYESTLTVEIFSTAP